MNNFMTLHPLLTVSVIGSFLGTILAYIVPGFTNNYMCAGRGFRIGNLGLNVFIHNGWAHLFGNLMILVPGALMVESLCRGSGCPLTVIVIIAFLATIIGEIPVIFSRDTLCGFSEIAFLLLEMGLVWHGMISNHKIFWFIFALGVAIISIGADLHTKHNYKFGHILGLVLGALSGFIFGSVF